MCAFDIRDVGSIWKTIAELDVNKIRDEATAPVSIICCGSESASSSLERLLFEGPDRYPRTTSILSRRTLPVQKPDDLRRADLVIFVFDAEPQSGELQAVSEVADDCARALAVLLGPTTGDASVLPPSLSPVQIQSTNDLEAAGRLATAVLGQLPPGLHTAVTRHLPGLRVTYTRDLIVEVSLGNAAIATAAAFPQLLPVVSLPVTATETVVLTKNQVFMTYRLALAHGAPPQFDRHLAELAPVVGAGFVWRGAAQTAADLVPFGAGTNVAIAYAGTYVTGHLAALWYQNGAVTKAQRKELYAKARKDGADVARAALKSAEGIGHKAGVTVGTGWKRVKGLRQRMPRRSAPKVSQEPRGGSRG
jgi:hypothetical protein